MSIRDMRDGDRADVRAVFAAAFADEPVVPDLAEALRARPGLGAALVAEADGAIVGAVQLSTSWVDAPRALVPALVLSPLGVRPDRQRTGIGRQLVSAALDTADRLGAPLVFLEGDPAYYSRLGWLRASEQGFIPPSIRIPDAAFQVVTLSSHEPWMTGAVVYNDTFWSHDCVGLRAQR